MVRCRDDSRAGPWSAIKTARTRESGLRLRTELLRATCIVDESGSHHEYRDQDRPGELTLLRRRCPDGGGARQACRRTR